MPIPIPNGKQIIIQKNTRLGQYCMPSMEISTDHYDISYIISGDRKVITPLKSYSYHKGDIAMGIPYLYHRTLSESNEPYENYLIKFTPEFIEPFFDKCDKSIFDELTDQRICRFDTEKQQTLKNMFEEMLEEYKKNKPYTEFILQCMLFRLLITIYENKLKVDIQSFKTPLTDPILNAIYYIENNYNKDLTLKETAQAVHFSCGHFSRLFKKQLGISFSQYLCNVRLNYVKRLLIKTNKTITEIALEVGYCNADYLSSQFKANNKMTPTEFRKRNYKN